MGLLGEGGAIDDAARERGPPAGTRSSPASAARSPYRVVVTWRLCVSRVRRGHRDLSSWSKTLMQRCMVCHDVLCTICTMCVCVCARARAPV